MPDRQLFSPPASGAEFQAERMINYTKLLMLGMTLESKHYLDHCSLLLCVVHVPWYTVYRDGSDSDLDARQY